MPVQIPIMMRAVQLDSFGGPDVLELRSVPVPPPGPDQVLVRVHASALNPKDAIFRRKAATPWPRPRFPRGTGFDFAGVVAKTGAGVADLQPGQQVWGFLDGVMGGAAAEFVLVPRPWLSAGPAMLDPVAAATLPLVGSAALQALRDLAELRPGERLLIRGASGAVGSAAIQIGKALGTHVTAIASGRGADRCSAAGADVVMTEAELLTAPKRVAYSVFLDCAGGSTVRRFAPLLGRGGRWVTIAANVPVFILTPLSGLIRWLGAPRFAYLVVRPRSADLEELARLVMEGRLRPTPIAPFALEEIRAAHHALDRRGRSARPVLAISPEAIRATSVPNEEEVSV